MTPTVLVDRCERRAPSHIIVASVGASVGSTVKSGEHGLQGHIWVGLNPNSATHRCHVLSTSYFNSLESNESVPSFERKKKKHNPIILSGLLEN